MKRIIITGLMMLLLASFISAGCDSGSKCETAKIQHADLQSQVSSLKADHEADSQKIAALEADLQDMFQKTGKSMLENPTWEELKRFIEVDQTDTFEYIPNEFDCEGFAIKLRDNAWRRGFRSAYVAIGFGENAAGHTLNAFQTTDKGLVYIDNAQKDTVGYVKSGEMYGTIAIEGVKEEYIRCNMRPDEFWKPISYTKYTDNIFEYDYYQNYTQRDKFYSDSVVAYNNQVSDYNSAVGEFNRGGRIYSHSELEDWEERIETWSKNIDKLIEDLGSVRMEPLGTVKSLEIYWN